jgi:hypothetical protein
MNDVVHHDDLMMMHTEHGLGVYGCITVSHKRRIYISVCENVAGSCDPRTSKRSLTSTSQSRNRTQAQIPALSTIAPTSNAHNAWSPFVLFCLYTIPFGHHLHVSAAPFGSRISACERWWRKKQQVTAGVCRAETKVNENPRGMS